MSEGTIASELAKARGDLGAAIAAHGLDKRDAAKAVALDAAWSRVTFMTTLFEMVERESERASYAVKRLEGVLKDTPDDASARAELDAAKTRAALTKRLMAP